jgi:hypothetical protein
MSLLTIILVIVAVGVLLWLINSFVPMHPTVRRVLNGAVTILLVVWLLDAFGLIDVLQNTQIEPVA